MGYQGRELKDLQKIVEAVPRPYYIEHQLLFSWTFWIYRHQSQVFINNLKRFVTVRTGEQFFRVFNYMKSCNDMPLNMGVYIFKESIRPMWEDSSNKNGGRWFFNSRKEENAEELWLEVLFAMIGEHFNDKNRNINGAFVVSKTSFNRIGIWIRDASAKPSCVHIGKIMKKVTNADNITFEAHDGNRKINYEV